MGLFSKIFKSKVKSISMSVPTSYGYAFSKGKESTWGGWALDRFRSIISAHSSVDEIAEEFELDGEDCEYSSLDGYDNCYTQAYEEEYEKAEALAEADSLMGIISSPEEYLNWDAIYEKAYNYAIRLAQAWLSGDEWIPEEILDWAWYDVSDHNS